MLEQQHRMHAQIMAFPSRTMYRERLRAAPAVAGHTLEDLAVASDPLRARPLWLVDTAGKDWGEHHTSRGAAPRAPRDSQAGSRRSSQPSGARDDEPGTSLTNIPVIRFDPSTFNPGHAE